MSVGIAEFDPQLLEAEARFAVAEQAELRQAMSELPHDHPHAHDHAHVQHCVEGHENCTSAHAELLDHGHNHSAHDHTKETAHVQHCVEGHENCTAVHTELLDHGHKHEAQHRKALDSAAEAVVVETTYQAIEQRIRSEQEKQSTELATEQAPTSAVADSREVAPVKVQESASEASPAEAAVKTRESVEINVLGKAAEEHAVLNEATREPAPIHTEDEPRGSLVEQPTIAEMAETVILPPDQAVFFERTADPKVPIELGAEVEIQPEPADLAILVTDSLELASRAAAELPEVQALPLAEVVLPKAQNEQLEKVELPGIPELQALVSSNADEVPARQAIAIQLAETIMARSEAIETVVSGEASHEAMEKAFTKVAASLERPTNAMAKEAITAETRQAFLELLELLHFQEPETAFAGYLDRYGQDLLHELLTKLFELQHQARHIEHSPTKVFWQTHMDDAKSLGERVLSLIRAQVPVKLAA